ncbi:MFS transporter [Sphingomonas sp. RB3P16]|uniref:MFS transporter n=1 Tax=Parasphingomonas frigoris TaxID=3096163 RepID=UPI002FC86ADD
MKALADYFRSLTLKPQGITVVMAGFLPLFAIVSMFPVVASMIQHFADDPDAKAKVPLMVTAPGLTIALLAPFAGFFVDRFGRRTLLLWCTFFYGLFGTAPFFLNDLDTIFASRLLLGVTEAGILTIVNTLIGDYWDDRGRRNWLFLQGIAGPFLASGVILLTGTVASLRWNGGFLVYLVAFPIYFAMLAYMFEPKRPEIVVAPSAPARVVHPFPMTTALQVAALTLFVSALYYVFIVNGSLAFQEIGVTSPQRVSQLSWIPSLFVMFGALLFRLLAGRSNAVQLGAFLVVLGAGLTGIGLSTTVPVMVMSLVLQQTGAGMAIPTLIVWAQTKFSFEHRGRGMGLWTGAFFLGQFVSPWLVHRLDLATGSIHGAFLVAGLAALGVAVGALVVALRTGLGRSALAEGA